MKENRLGIVIYSIPKSGTHLLSNIISLMIDKNTNIYKKEEMYKIVPHLKKINVLNFFFSTHPKYIKFADLIDKKYYLILLIRNPIDLCISSYFFYEKRKPVEKQISIFEYIKKNIINVSKRVYNFYKLQKENKNNTILVKFEDLVLNLDKEIINIRNLLNKYYTIKKNNCLSIREKINFKKVRKEEKKNGIYKVGRIQNSLFHRSGKVGQVKDHLNQNQINEIMELIPKYIYEIYPEKLYL